jgi:hypothetical protein
MTNLLRSLGARHGRRLVPIACGAALVLTGCSITEPSSRSGNHAELSRNRQLWASARLDDYEFDYRLSCFCTQESTEQVRIVVRDDVVSSVVRVRDGAPALPKPGGWPTIEALFADVERLLDSQAERIEVSYDPTYGYPRQIAVDVHLMAADDGSFQTAANLRPLP